MNFRILCFPLFLAVSFAAVASDLYTAINALRRGEGNCAVARQLPPLRAQGALERVGQYLARGNNLEQSLKAAGYRATRSRVLWFEGERVGAQVAGMLASQSYCPQLQDAALTEVGFYLDEHKIWIVMAAPFSPLPGVSQRSAGQRVLELVNQARARGRNCGGTAFKSVRPVSWNDALAEASGQHSEDMARYDYFSHRGRDDSYPAQRVERAGYRYRATGENIAGG